MLQQAIKGRDRFDPASWSLRNWKQIQWQVVTVDTLICTRSGFVFALWIASEGTAEADAIVYDGQSIAPTRLVNLYAVDEAMAILNFFPPLYFQQGIYIDVGTNVAQVGIQYLPEPVM